MNIRVPTSVAVASIFLLLVGFVLAFAYGVAVVRYKLPPYEMIADVEEALRWTADRTTEREPWYYSSTARTETIYSTEGAPKSGLNLVTSVAPDNTLSLKVVDMAGELVHSWPVDWFDIWPDASHLPPQDVPKMRPGTHLHGMLLLPDGDILFNFEKLGLVRMGLCGDVRWKLPYQTHHSVFMDDAGSLWVSAMRWHTETMPNYPAHVPPIREPVVLKVSPEGELLEEISVFDLLAENDYRALHNMRAGAKSNTVTGDSLHLNDVEVFPGSMEEGFFKHGDIVISLRNIHTVIVFDPATRKIKLLKVGGFIRQHDPDFIDGNTLMIFDNNTIGPQSFGQQSRILLFDAQKDELSVKYTGSPDNPFYTYIMGKQQLLENGNLLISDSINGRAFEVNEAGEIVWEFVNLVGEGRVGIVEEVERLPESYRHIFEITDCIN